MKEGAFLVLVTDISPSHFLFHENGNKLGAVAIGSQLRYGHSVSFYRLLSWISYNNCRGSAYTSRWPKRLSETTRYLLATKEWHRRVSKSPPTKSSVYTAYENPENEH